ncbi:MAG: histidine kinase [Bacteroidota bacterium]
MARKSTYEILGFNDRLLMLIGIPMVALILPILMPDGVPGETWPFFRVKALIGLVYTIIFWMAGRTITIQLRRRYPNIEDTRKRLMMMIVGLLGVIVLVTLGMKPLVAPLVVEYCPPGYRPEPLPIMATSAVICLSVMGIYEARAAISKWKDTLVEAERLRKENVQSQLDRLKSQVNPHFLFNSLNTLSSLVHESPDTSVEFIQNLSRTYRYILEIKDRELISLDEELECIDAYVFLLEMRFGDNLVVSIEIPESYYGHYLAPLSLQLLIENAIKHNVVSRKRPLRIVISVNAAGNLVVRNNLQLKQNVGKSTQTGLSNIKNRYALLVKREVQVISGPEYFTVILPLIKLEKHESSDH